MKIYNKLVQTGIILNFVGSGLFLLLILNSWISNDFLLYVEVFYLLITFGSIVLNINLFIGTITNLKLVGILSSIGSILLFLTGIYSYQETPILLVFIGSSLLLYSAYKNNDNSNKNVESSSENKDPFLKRAELFLEEKDFQKTIEYSEKALDKNPQAGLAYLYKLLAQNKVVSLNQYVLSGKPIDKLIKDPLYKRFKQFTPLYILSTVEKPIVIELEKINLINETSHLLKKEDLKDNLEVLETNLVALNRIHPFKNSSTLVYQLEQKISRTKELISESRYLEALKLIKGNNYHKLKDAVLILNQLNDYKDSTKLIRKVEAKLNELNRLRSLKTLKISSKFALIGIVLGIVFNLTNTLFFKTYTISFVTNGGPNLQPFSLRFNEEINLPLVQKVGHSFDDWYLDQGLTNLHEVERMPAENITLYAKWSVNQYTITFITNGGGGIQPITKDYGSTLNVPQINKTGYSFGGWYKDQGLTQLYIVPVSMPAESLTLHARWVVNRYTITFVTNGGNVIPVQNNAYGSGISLPSANKTGHLFLGWFTDSSLNTEFSLSTMPAENITLYAKWQINPYTITFISNGGSSVQSITQDFASAVVAPTNPTRSGYSFLGWFIDEALTNAYTFTTMPSQNQTLYAKWTILFSFLEFSSSHSSSALTQSGRVFMWGLNDYGQLGDGSTENKVFPNEITSQFVLSNGDKIISVNLGAAHSSALTSTGRVFMWGRNSSGRLGDGTTSDISVPFEITSQFELSNGDKIISVNLGAAHSSALTSTGRVFMWGRNSSGQLGDGTILDKSVPFEITSQFALSNGDKIISVTLGESHSSALTSTGRVFMWGTNSSGELGLDHSINLIKVPNEISSGYFSLTEGETIISLFLKHHRSSALTSNGRVFMWGSNVYGELGDASNINKNRPTEISSHFLLSENDKIVFLSLGVVHSSALSSTGRVFTWGYNGYGELGDGTIINKNLPNEITNQFLLSDGQKIISLTLGSFYSSALTNDGRVFMWGYNEIGQLGDGTLNNRVIPIKIIV